MKINIGCGDVILPGFVNCDLYNPAADIKCDVEQLPFKDNIAELILSWHVIEHFDFYKAVDVMKEWYRVLQPNGKLEVQTPDFLALCKVFLETPEDERYMYYDHFFAKPWIPGQIHKFLYTEECLGRLFFKIGFKNIKRIPANRYYGAEYICLGMEGYK